MSETGDKIKKAAHDVGEAVSNAATQASNYVKEKLGAETTDVGVAGIKEHMDVIASCGTKIGVVDHVEGTRLKLTRKDSADGLHHYIPTSWVAKVDAHVHLSKNHKDAMAEWTAA